jgi:RNA polymerase sigma-70 factor (sigma-E family)
MVMQAMLQEYSLQYRAALDRCNGRAPEERGLRDCRTSGARVDNAGRRSASSTAELTRSRTEEFTALVGDHHRRLTRLAYLLCSDPAQAEDAVSEAYARMWPCFRAGDVREPLPYLRAAVVNQVRAGMRHRQLEQRDQPPWRVGWRNGQSPERAADDRALLAAALAQLPDAQRAVIVLRFHEGLREHEVAILLGISIGTVKSRSARALARLRSLVPDLEGAGK